MGPAPKSGSLISVVGTGPLSSIIVDQLRAIGHPPHVASTLAPGDAVNKICIVVGKDWPETTRALNELVIHHPKAVVILAWDPGQGELGNTDRYATSIAGCLLAPWTETQFMAALRSARRMGEGRSDDLRCRILVIEDDPDHAHLLRRRLKRAELAQGGSVEGVDRLDAGLEALRRSSFDLIFTDLSLPDARGLDTVNQLHSASQDIPIVVTSSLDDEDVAARALDAGAQEYVVKDNIDDALLRRVVRCAVARKRSERALHRLAHEDVLTNLPNRRAFMEALHEAFHPSNGHPCGLAVAMVDLDHFKRINDGHGHEAGDEVLRQSALRLRGAVRSGDVVARLGGDEFAVLLVGASKTDAEAVADRIRQALDGPIDFESHTLQVSGSIGVIHSLRPSAAPAAFLALADRALYAAKKSRNEWVLHHDAVPDLSS